MTYVIDPTYDNTMFPRLGSYDAILVMFSGGKDSLACLLHLLESGVDRDKIELHHHSVDGHEGSTLMDWPITTAYVAAVAEALDIDLYFSWKTGGFEREMMRDNTNTAAIQWQKPDGTLGSAGGKSSRTGTRLKFPQVSGDLRVRWCSAYLKIDVAAATINNQERFKDKRTLVVTGERAEEATVAQRKTGKGRAGYKEFESHRTHCTGKRVNRHVDQWRPVHSWSEQRVWDIIERWKVRPHPAYYLGFGRVSCMSCIFGSKDQWATVKEIAPTHFERIAVFEEQFGLTIQRNKSIREQADAGVPYDHDKGIAWCALGTVYDNEIIAENWVLPSGAYGDNTGPT